MAFILIKLICLLISVSVNHSLTVNHSLKLSETTDFLPEPEIPEECLDQRYCEHVSNYPKQLAAKLIAKIRDSGGKYPKLDISNLTNQKDIRRGELKHQVMMQLPTCLVVKKKVAPKAAKDSNGIWHFILNDEENHFQHLYVTECKKDPHQQNNKQSCEDFLVFSGGHGRCTQKHVDIKITTFNGRGVLSSKSFSLPCCCSCEAYLP